MQMQDHNQPQWLAIGNHTDKGMVLIKLSVQNRYVRLMNFEIEVPNTLKTSAYQLTGVSKGPSNQTSVRLGGSTVSKDTLP